MVRRALPPLRGEVDGAEPLDLFLKVDPGRIQLALDRVHAGGVDLLAHLRALVVRLEGFADLLAVVHEVEDEGVLLEGMHAVQPGQRLHGLDAGEPLVHEHRVQERLIEPGLVLLRDEQNLVLLAREALGQLLLGDAVVHAGLGVGDAREPVVHHGARKGHQRPDGVALLPDAAIEALLVADRFEARPGHHHRLGPAADLVPRHRLEVLDHHLRLLRDVVGVQPHEPRQRLRGLLALDGGVVLARLEQPEVRPVRGVVLQHVEDEPLLDRLPHGVAVHRPPLAAEHGEGPVLRGGGEGEEAEVRLPSPLGHAAEELFQVFPALLGGTLPRLFPKVLSAQHLLEVRRRLAALGAVRLVDDDRATPGRDRSRAGRSALFRHLEQVARDERELLQGGDDHRHRALKRFGELARAFVDPLHDPAPVLELVDRVLELLIEHDAVGDHDHAVEDALVGRVMQGREPMGEPADRVALAAARGVLDEVVVARALAAGGVHQQADRLELVMAGEDHGLHPDLAPPVVALLVDLQVDEAGEEVEQAVGRQHLLPQVCRAVVPAGGVGRVAGCALESLVERQEFRRFAGQPGGHEHRLGIHGEMNQCASLELEDRLTRVPLALVLAPSVLDGLAGERVLQFQRHHRNAVQAQRDVERLLGVRREMELAGKSQAVGGIASLEFRIQIVRRLEVRRAKRSAVALEPMTKCRERAVSVHPLAQIAEHLLLSLGAVKPFQLGPILWLGFADEGKDRIGKDCAFAVEAVPGDRHITIREQMRLDNGFEGCFGMTTLAHVAIPASFRLNSQTAT